MEEQKRRISPVSSRLNFLYFQIRFDRFKTEFKCNARNVICVPIYFLFAKPNLNFYCIPSSDEKSSRL